MNNDTVAPGMEATWLIKLYMKANQGMYAVVAFPIGTVLSITPLLYYDQGATLVHIGCMMALGELFGIFAMLFAEKSEKGFVFRRPYDMYLINAALALSLVLIPFTTFTGTLWYVSAIFMILVQFFNSASKPVMGESLHRLAVLTEKAPSIVFAKANFFRRVGNSVMGFVTPLMYAYFEKLPFVLIGGVILLFVISCYAIDTKIKSICMDDLNAHPESERRLSRRMSFEHTSLSHKFTERESFHSTTSRPRRSRRLKRNTRRSTISMLSNLSKRQDGRSSTISIQDGRSEQGGRRKTGNDSIYETPKPMPTSVDMHYDLEDNSTPADKKHYFGNASARSNAKRTISQDMGLPCYEDETNKWAKLTRAIIEEGDETYNEEGDKFYSGELVPNKFRRISALSYDEEDETNKWAKLPRAIIEEGDETYNEEEDKFRRISALSNDGEDETNKWAELPRAIIEEGDETYNEEEEKFLTEDEEDAINRSAKRTQTIIEEGDETDNEEEEKFLTKDEEDAINRSAKRTQTIIEEGDETDNEEEEKFLTKDEEDAINRSAKRTQTIVEEGDEENNEEDEKPVHDASRIEKGREENDETIAPTVEKESNLSYYLIVWIFPFWDAVISRLPFSFLMICIVDPQYDELNGFGEFVDKDRERKKMIILAGVVLFAYQSMRAVAQSIQVWRCDTTINYVLNVIALLGYFAFAMIAQFSDTRLWFIPIVFTGFAETLPIQQLYLMGLFADGDGDEGAMSIRRAVQTSHTFTGAGSCVAFLVGSQIYDSFQIQGIAYLGLTVMVLKLATNIVIDVLHNKKEKKVKTTFRQDSATYMKVFESQRVVVPS